MAETASIPNNYPLDIWVTNAGLTGTASNDLHIYVNGADLSVHPVNGTAPSSGSSAITTDPLRIGASTSAGGMSGLTIDEFDMVPGVVTPETIQGTWVNMH